MIRPATDVDADSVAILWQRLAQFHHALDPELPIPSENGTLRYVTLLHSRLVDPYTRVLVAEEDGQIVGFVLGAVVDIVQELFVQERGGFVADIYVDPAYRRRGIGRALVNALVEWFRERQLRYCEWYVAARNAEGRQFWRSVGGRELMLRMRANLGER